MISRNRSPHLSEVSKKWFAEIDHLTLARYTKSDLLGVEIGTLWLHDFVVALGVEIGTLRLHDFVVALGVEIGTLWLNDFVVALGVEIGTLWLNGFVVALGVEIGALWLNDFVVASGVPEIDHLTLARYTKSDFPKSITSP